MTEDTVVRPKDRDERAIGHYRILRKLAAGGMGEVFLAEDMRLHRRAAVKVISQAFAHDRDRKRRFLREAQAASALNHSNIAVIYDIGETPEGISFIGMEYVDGATLAEVMREELPLERMLDYAIGIVDGVAEAHRQGIIHRDLKPQNVMITTRQSVKVLDFGLAKMAEIPGPDKSALTDSGAVMGTLSYLSPEQARGEALDPRSDLFSIGVILYQMATRQLPFAGGSAFETLEKIVRTDPEPVTNRNPAMPREFAKIVERCLEKERERRYASADDLLTDLKSLRVTGSLTEVSVTSDVPPRPRRQSSFSAPAKDDRQHPTQVSNVAASGTPSGDRSRAVAVLPFRSSRTDVESESFGDGMAEELINTLSNVEGLRVASRTSSFAFRNSTADVRTIAETLRAGKIVEGSVRKAGDQIRVTVQLVNADDGYQVWSQTFDRRLDDVFAIQDEIARAVAQRVSGAAIAQLHGPPTKNLEAYQALVMGRHLAGKNSIENLRKAITSLEEALALDPNLAVGFVELARANLLLVARTGISPEEGLPRAIEAAERALQIDPRLDSAHAVLSDIRVRQLRWTDAEQHINKAIALNPDSPEVHRSQSRLLLHLGKHGEAVRAAEKAYRLNAANVVNLGRTLYHAREFSEALPRLQNGLAENPESAVIQFYIAMSLAQLNRFAEAETAMKKAIELAGDQRWRAHLAHVFALAGQQARAEELLQSVMRDTPEKDYPRPDFAAVYAVLGDNERALTWLESAYEVKPSDLTEMKAEPDFVTLRSEPRFQLLLQRMGLCG